MAVCGIQLGCDNSVISSGKQTKIKINVTGEACPEEELNRGTGVSGPAWGQEG